MSSKEFGGYKRIVQYFWDPEPKNDDPSNSPIWCLGQRYDPQSRQEIDKSTTNQGREESEPLATTEQTIPRLDKPESTWVNGETQGPGSQTVPPSEHGAWPSDFLDDFESRIWMTYRFGFPSIRRSEDHKATASMTFAVRLRSQLVDQGGALSRDYQEMNLKVYINGDGADVYEDSLLSMATADGGHFTPILILVGIRLGIDCVTPAYWEPLKAALQLPQSVGIAGGRPSSSHYFVGHQADNFFFLDPHQPRQALARRNDVTEYSKADIDSCHNRRLRRLPLQEMDPSMLIGFLIRDKGDWDDWRRRVTEVQGKPVVHVADTEPAAIGQNVERAGAVDEVETLDDDEGDGEMIERPI
ncbi:MAG: hypothetical protein Q9186_000974 [Xanthomendoza sp. 1 TL-2023]